MPTAGDEGYERLVICPYDKAHEIRAGRMQFHLDKCRKNHPNSELIECPFNASHIIPKVELEFHTEDDCMSRINWDMSYHEVGNTVCPVKDLVPVNAATVPDGGENWDNFEAPGSVLDTIRTKVVGKGVLRMAQCVPRAQKKAFRLEERKRHNRLRAEGPPKTSDDQEDTFFATHMESLPKPPTKTSNIRIVKQDPAVAIAEINKQFRSLDLTGNNKRKTSSVSNGFSQSVKSEPSTHKQAPLSYAAISSKPVARNSRPSSSMSCRTSSNESVSLLTALSNSSHPTTSMATARSYIDSRPPSALSNCSSLNRVIPFPDDEEGFCTIPIPGLGRGRRRAKQ